VEELDVRIHAVEECE
jgi:hypothetical protein